MKNLPLCVIPNIDFYQERIRSVQGEIKNTLGEATIDFLMVSSIFKRYSQFSSPATGQEEAVRMSLAVKELQYMDTFSQKLNHIMDLHTLLEKNQAHPEQCQHDHAGFVFKLNYMQAVAATRTFVSIVTDLKKNLHELHHHILSVTGMDFTESDYFRHLPNITEGMNSVSDLLGSMAVDRQEEAPIHTGIKNDVMEIAKLYSMDSERYVLVWLANHPQGTSEEMVALYDADGFGRVEEEIELF